MPNDTAVRTQGMSFRGSILPQIPNFISICRMAAAPALAGMILKGEKYRFTFLLLACLLSDIADGLVARGFHVTSKLGAILDSTADILTSCAAVGGLVAFQMKFVAAHYPALLVVVVFYLASVIAAFYRYGKVSSFHTYSSRAAAYAQGIFVMTLFMCGFNAALFHVMVVVSVAAYLEEFVILWLLSEWKADVRGACWVLRDKRLDAP